MDFVFVVMHGEKYEGGDAKSIHKTREGAIAAALAVPALFNDKKWKKIVDTPEVIGWENGCDYVHVIKKWLHE